METLIKDFVSEFGSEVLFALGAFVSVVVGAGAKIVVDAMGTWARRHHLIDEKIDKAVRKVETESPHAPEVLKARTVKHIVAGELKEHGASILNRALVWGVGRVGRSVKKSFARRKGGGV